MWKQTGNCLVREFSFDDFKSALVFVDQIGQLAEQAQHHPDIELGWGRVKVSLTSHDSGGVTDKDHQLAKQIDKLPLIG
jgi:4a-hydroxytetrahydrobiopterin dehydratase